MREMRRRIEGIRIEFKRERCSAAVPAAFASKMPSGGAYIALFAMYASEGGRASGEKLRFGGETRVQEHKKDIAPNSSNQLKT
jgi:hypothetical protein